jgi:SAM-dependent methyltransferase
VTSKNRAFWNASSDAYQQAHGHALDEKPLAWGVWRIPEADLRILGDLEGRDVLELGCGAAQWTISLLQAGARAIGIDLSERQLDHARSRFRKSGKELSLVHSDAESLPFRDESFDVVFCDHGATVFAPPESSVPEASRILRPGGLFAFCISSPIRDLCWSDPKEEISPQLKSDYFDLHDIPDDEETSYQLPYGAWIRLFRQNAFEVEDLIELQPTQEASTTYSDFAPKPWARRWPAENIWKLRKRRA